MARGALLMDGHAIGAGQTGNETWARNVLSAVEQDERREQVHHLLAARGRTAVAGEVDPLRVHSVADQSWRRLLVDIPRAVRSCRATAALCHYTLPPRLSVPAVLVVHDVSFHDARASEWIPRRSLARYRFTIDRSVRRAALVLTPSEHARETVLAHYALDPERVEVAGNAVSPAFARELARAQKAPMRDWQDVLVVGTVLPRKNVLVVARAVAALRRQGDDVRLRLVGPVREAGKADLAAAGELLGDALMCVGEVPLQRLVQEYVDADVLAMPSLYEGFGIPVLEAMAAGTPVVCSDATSLPEVAGGAALLANPHEPDDWAAALSEALARPAPLIAQGHQRVSAFSWDRTADVVLEAMTRVAL